MMKKLISLFLCLLLCLSFTACDADAPASDEPAAHDHEVGDVTDHDHDAHGASGDAKTVLSKVLKKEQAFSFKSLISEEITTETLERFSFATPAAAKVAFVPQSFCYVDMDGDGVEELAVVDARLQYFLILRYDDSTVYGYILRGISLQHFKADGSVLNTVSDGVASVCRLNFDGADYTLEQLAHKVAKENVYLLEGKTVTEAQWDAYFAQWEKTQTLPWKPCA